MKQNLLINSTNRHNIWFSSFRLVPHHRTTQHTSYHVTWTSLHGSTYDVLLLNVTQRCSYSSSSSRSFPLNTSDARPCDLSESPGIVPTRGRTLMYR